MTTDTPTLSDSSADLADMRTRAEVAARWSLPPGEVHWPPELVDALLRLPEAGQYLQLGTVAAALRFLQTMGMTSDHIASYLGQSASYVRRMMNSQHEMSAPRLAEITRRLKLPPGSLIAPRVVRVKRALPRRKPPTSAPVMQPPYQSGPGGRWCLCALTPTIAVEIGVARRWVPLWWTGVEMRALRLSQHLTVREFADQLSIHFRTLAKWERTANKPPHWLQGTLDRLLLSADPIEQARFMGWLAPTIQASSG